MRDDGSFDSEADLSSRLDDELDAYYDSIRPRMDTAFFYREPLH